MSPETKQTVTDLIKHEIHNIKPVLIHYNHQWSIAPEDRILDMDESELESQVKTLRLALNSLLRALKEIENDNTQMG